MAQIESQSTSPTRQFRQFVIPSGLELILYGLIAIMILVAFNATDIWTSISSSLSLSPSQENVNTSASSSVWSDIANSRIPQIVFWGMIGVAIYTIVWFVWNIVTNLRNDVAADQFVHPRHYSRSKYWQSVLSRKVFFGLISLIFIVYLFVFFRLVALISNLAYSASDPLVIPSGVAELGIYVLLTLALIYALVVLGRLVAHSWRAIYRDL